MKSSPQLNVGGHCCSMRRGEGSGGGGGVGYWETGVEMTGQGGTPAEKWPKKRASAVPGGSSRGFTLGNSKKKKSRL